jgi:hypothetical protein
MERTRRAKTVIRKISEKTSGMVAVITDTMFI